MSVDAIKQLINAGVSELPESRVQGALELAELSRQNLRPTASPFAFVLPTGFVARSEGDAGSGIFTQLYDEMFAVVLSLDSAGDATGEKAVDPLDDLVRKIVAAVAGRDTEIAIGVFVPRRGQLLKNDAGHIVYQIDFAISQQLRILT